MTESKEKAVSGKLEHKKVPSKSEKEELLNMINAIQEEYGGNLSDIPVTHEYWDLMNAYRRIKK